MDKRIVIRNHDVCPKCQNLTLPRIELDSTATAARCQHCGIVLERWQVQKFFVGTNVKFKIPVTIDVKVIQG